MNNAVCRIFATYSSDIRTKTAFPEGIVSVYSYLPQNTAYVHGSECVKFTCLLSYASLK